MLNAEYAKKIYYKDVEKSRARGNAITSEGVRKLSDYYVKNKIRDATGISAKDIPQELVEAKRIELKIIRLIKEKRNEQKSC